jgi:hypothetical protein
MANPALPEKQVYLALKDIFSGLPTPPSNVKKIRKTIEKHKNEAKVASLIRGGYGVERIAAVAQILVGDHVFASDATAKLRFPGVFESPSSQPSQSTISGTPVTSGLSTASGPSITASSAATVQCERFYSAEELLGIGDRLKLRKAKEKMETSMSIQRIVKPH